MNAQSWQGGAGIGNGRHSEKMFPSGATVLGNMIGDEVAIDVQGGTVIAKSGYLPGAGNAKSAFVFSTIARPQIPIRIYYNAKITGDYSEDPTTVISNVQDVLNKYLNYVTIVPCGHEHATWKITATTHQKQCSECRSGFDVQAHTGMGDGVCDVCGYRDNSVIVTFDSDGGTAIGSQSVISGQTAAEPTAPPGTATSSRAGIC